LSNFGMKGNATPRGMTITEWAGAIFGGAISGTANVRWSGSWSVEGVLTVRNINAAVFAPALLSSGNAEGTGKFSMSGADAGALSGRIVADMRTAAQTLRGTLLLGGTVKEPQVRN